MNRNVPKQVEEGRENDRPSRKRSARDSKFEKMQPLFSLATSNKCSVARDLVSGAIIFFFALLMTLLVGCDGAIHDQSSLDPSGLMTAASSSAFELERVSDRRVGRSPLATAGLSSSSRISEMFALLGPRRDESPSMATQESAPALTLHLFGAEQVPARDEKLVGSEAHKGPPVYRSAPKQIIEIREELAPKKKLGSEAPKIVKKIKEEATKQSGSDLHSAAGFHQPKHRLGARRKSHAYPAHYTYFGKYHE